jgi:hypothetical protein
VGLAASGYLFVTPNRRTVTQWWIAEAARTGVNIVTNRAA